MALSIAIKIIDKNKPNLVDEAKGELEGAGYKVVFENYAELFLGVDAKKNGNGEQNYGPSVMIIGEK